METVRIGLSGISLSRNRSDESASKDSFWLIVLFRFSKKFLTMTLEKPKGLLVAVSTVVPLIIGIVAPSATLLLRERYGMDSLPVVLVGWCAALVASAVWLNHVVFRRKSTLAPFLVALATILVIWLWQRFAFTMLVPRSGLTYGYFLRPEGAQARFWVLTCPSYVGIICITIAFLTALVHAWRIGFRGLLACLIPWWLTAFLIFGLPSVYLDGQGNASIFI
jgi:hypothetical protein